MRSFCTQRLSFLDDIGTVPHGSLLHCDIEGVFTKGRGIWTQATQRREG